MLRLLLRWFLGVLVFKQNQMTCGGSQNVTPCQDFNPWHGIMMQITPDTLQFLENGGREKVRGGLQHMYWCAGIQAETGVNHISDCDPMARFQSLPWYQNRVPEVDPSRHPPILGEWSDVETAVDMVPWCTSIPTESDDMWGISECDPMPRFQSLACQTPSNSWRMEGGRK